ncbi:nitric oxide reductase activation protein NorD [Mycolicibacterium septicum]|uniref:nitric oxide reductase activation protein NorD n=1 Tax=Mycolicibacterium septicum TaxID=98668 RepID=UPI001AF645A9|nr:VWA domain-containing protein [Mycolicibacterium septicum]QRY53006.1 VWA domain-containing protein [Mycolicibacterium septicum]
MTGTEPAGLQRFRLLATFIVGRAVDVAPARAGQLAHTDGRVVFVSADLTEAEQRRELVLQCALLAAGSLDRQWVKALRIRPALASRYLSEEGHRALAELASRVPLAATLCPVDRQPTAGPAESLALAKSLAPVFDPPEWFGVIRPTMLLRSARDATGPGCSRDARFAFDPVASGSDDDAGDDDANDEGPTEESKILKLFEAPAFTSRALSEFLRKMFGGSRSFGDDSAGAELPIGAVRRARQVGAKARSLPIRIEFADKGRPDVAVSVGGALYPEWDTHNDRYRPQWCRVIDFPLTSAAEVTPAGAAPDHVLRQRLSRVGLGPKILRGRADGDELDTEALVDLFVDLRSGHAPPEHIYTERRNLDRNLGVLILLDVSGSVTDADTEGLAVHDHQLQAAETLAATLEELGDRVAVYGFRSQGRQAVHLLAIKTFEQRFGAAERSRLGQLQPFGYTRLGAGIRGAGEILKTRAGAPHRLLLVLSDGYPYDDGYEGRYAQADTAKALEELRADGMACLCLSIGAPADPDALVQVFGSASHAGAATLSELSPRMDELFLSALAELAAQMPRRRASAADRPTRGVAPAGFAQ